MEITLGHISIAGLIGILVGLSTLWMRISATKKDAASEAAATAQHRTSVDHRLGTLES